MSNRVRSISVEDCLSNKVYISSSKFKMKLIKAGIKSWICEKCGLTEWNNQPIPLELHHLDGNKRNNSLSNIELICPNCHALTSNYCGRNVKNRLPDKFCVDCGKKIRSNSSRCRQCAPSNVKRVNLKLKISKEELYDLIWVQKLPYTTIGKMFGVSDNAIRKRCKLLDIKIRYRNFKYTIGDEDSNLNK